MLQLCISAESGNCVIVGLDDLEEMDLSKPIAQQQLAECIASAIEELKQLEKE